MAGAAAFIALGLALVSAEPDESILDVDKPVLSNREVEALRLETHVMNKVRGEPLLRVARGDTVFVELELLVKRPPRGELVVAVSSAQAVPGVRVLPGLESVEIDATRRKKKIRGLYVVRVKPNARLGRHDLSVVLTVFTKSGRRAATETRMHAVEVVAPEPSEASIELDRKAYLHFRSLARRATDAAGARSRLRADIAHQRLRTAADGADPQTSEQAVVAIGRLTKRPEGDDARAADVASRTFKQNLAAARIALEDLRIDQAEGILNRLRKGGKLERPQLARTLRMLGAVYAARGRQADASKHYGQALCVDPELGPPSKRQPMRRLFDDAKATSQCAAGVTIGDVTARRATRKGQLIVNVRISFGPDPHELISGGDIELWGPGGGLIEVLQVRAKHGTRSSIEAGFADHGDLENYAGQVLVRALLKDLSGVVIASVGDPSPRPVSVGAADNLGTPTLPWWLWVAGGIAVVGVATATVIATSGGDGAQAIGPISATF